MAAPNDKFEDWLNDKLRKLNTDQEVFGTYIKGILDGNDTEEEKREALEGILSEVANGNNTSSICDEIFTHWASTLQSNEHVIGTNSTANGVDAKIASIMEEQAKSIVTERKVTAEDKQLREAILAQYSQVCETEEGDDNDDDDLRSKEVGAAAATNALPPSEQYLVKNTNADNVLQAEKLKREKSKAENEKKKAQDKLNREKQKQQQQQRKEKEKKRTQKLERKR